jgi:hypothetical protein
MQKQAEREYVAKEIIVKGKYGEYKKPTSSCRLP